MAMDIQPLRGWLLQKLCICGNHIFANQKENPALNSKNAFPPSRQKNLLRSKKQKTSRKAGKSKRTNSPKNTPDRVLFFFLIPPIFVIPNKLTQT
jgi:hypothetical protein